MIRSDLLMVYLLFCFNKLNQKNYLFFSAIAQISYKSLLKTYKYGGRRNVPSQIELDALSVNINQRELS